MRPDEITLRTWYGKHITIRDADIKRVQIAAMATGQAIIRSWDTSGARISFYGYAFTRRRLQSIGFAGITAALQAGRDLDKDRLEYFSGFEENMAERLAELDPTAEPGPTVESDLAAGSRPALHAVIADAAWHLV